PSKMADDGDGPPRGRGQQGLASGQSDGGRMTLQSDLNTRYAPELKGFGASLPDDFSAALTELEPRLDADQLEQWARDGVALANASLRSWEAAAEYFRATPLVVERLGAEGVHDWVAIAQRLADASSLMAAAFLK